MGCIALHVLPMNPATPVRCWNAVAKGALTEAKLVVVALQAGWDTALRLDEVTIRLINEQYRSPAMFLGDVRKKDLAACIDSVPPRKRAETTQTLAEKTFLALGVPTFDRYRFAHEKWASLGDSAGTRGSIRQP